VSGNQSGSLVRLHVPSAVSYHRITPVWLGALIELLPTLARAGEEANEHGHGGIAWGMLLFSIINFVIFGWIIVRYAIPVARDWVRDRHDRIVAELEAAAKARAEAEQLKAQWEARLAALDREIQQIRAAAEADAARERDRILAEARKTAEAIRDDARRAAAQEVRHAEAELRQEVALRAVSLAAQLVREQMTTADQERFVSEFLREVKS
jgi:F-type H+-transporting ATPase subunit b